MMPAILAVWMPGPVELIVIGGVALLVFGRRLPEVARSLGKSIVEFKRGIKDVSDDVERQSSADAKSLPKPDRQAEQAQPSAPEGTKERSTRAPDSSS